MVPAGDDFLPPVAKGEVDRVAPAAAAAADSCGGADAACGTAAGSSVAVAEEYQYAYLQRPYLNMTILIN